MIKILENEGLERTYLIIIEVIHERPTVSIILNGEKVEAIPQIRNQTGLTIILTLFQYHAQNTS